MFGFILASKLRLTQAEVLEVLIKDELPLSRVRYENPDAVSFTVKGLTDRQVTDKLHSLLGDHFKVRRMHSADNTVDVFHLQLPDKQLNMLLPELDIQRLSDGTFLRALSRVGAVFRREALCAHSSNILALRSRAESLSANIQAADAELSPLQQGYQDFFKDQLTKRDADSPADLSEEGKRDFFNHIEKTWPSQKEKIMTSARKSAPLAALHCQNSQSYLLKITAAGVLPSRADIVSWCHRNGMGIEAGNVRIRSNVLRVARTDGALTVKPVAGLMAALQDYSPEYLLAEISDQVVYAHHGIRATGVVKGFEGQGLVVANDLTAELNVVPLVAVLKVSGFQVDEAQALSATDIAAKSVGL